MAPGAVTEIEASAAPAVPDAVVEFRDVFKSYTDPFHFHPKLAAIRGVSFHIEPGTVFGLLGPNRAGKTTLVKMLLSLCQPTAGEVFRLGRPLSDRSTLAQVGYVHENQAFPRYLTAADLLEYYGSLALIPYESVRERVPILLERVGLADRSREPIARFSKGMLQRLGMAQALLNEPRLLVLDEPTEGLDLAGRNLLRDTVREVRARGGSVLLITHVLPEVEQLCDRVAVVVRGRLAWLGATADLLRSASGQSRTLEEALQQIYVQPQP